MSHCVPVPSLGPAAVAAAYELTPLLIEKLQKLSAADPRVRSAGLVSNDISSAMIFRNTFDFAKTLYMSEDSGNHVLNNSKFKETAKKLVADAGLCFKKEISAERIQHTFGGLKRNFEISYT